jgi:hypothetical protein
VENLTRIGKNGAFHKPRGEKAEKIFCANLVAEQRSAGKSQLCRS